MNSVKVIKGEYEGRIGMATAPNQMGLVMFYPIEEKNPYRVCLAKEDVEYI